MLMFLILCSLVSSRAKYMISHTTNYTVFREAFFVYLAILLLPLFANAQQANDTLFINGKGSYIINKHLFIYETNKQLTPQFIYDSLKAKDFKVLYPSKTYNDIHSPSNYYWLKANPAKQS